MLTSQKKSWLYFKKERGQTNEVAATAEIQLKTVYIHPKATVFYFSVLDQKKSKI